MTMSWNGDRAPFAKAFIAAQRATDAIARASTNPVFQYKYADLATVVEAVVPALNACGIGVIQCPALDGELMHRRREIQRDVAAMNERRFEEIDLADAGVPDEGAVARPTRQNYRHGRHHS